MLLRQGKAVVWRLSKLCLKTHRRRLLVSPAGSHENLQLELPRFGRPRTVRALREAVRSLSPQIIGLLETKKRAVDIESLRCKLGFQNGFGVSCKGRSGGLALLWDDTVCVEVSNYSFWHIDVVIRDNGVWRLSLFYGNPAVNMRRESWNLLRKLHTISDTQWVVIGDFNEVLDAIEDCGLSDIGFTGYPYTFSNHREGEFEVQARLDRVLADDSWRRNFPRAAVSHIHLHVSDHQLLVLDTDKICQVSRKKLFRFEAMWLEHPQYNSQMRDFWNSCGEGRDSWSKKLMACSAMLRSWNRSVFEDVRKKIEKLKHDLEMVKSEYRSEDMIEREKNISEELDLWLAREETLWMQRSIVMWMSLGDKNTKFFHARASQRRKKNWITNL
ncbi:hypothetical protein QQ045_028256 [Rhodiola kirilowii]